MAEAVMDEEGVASDQSDDLAAKDAKSDDEAPTQDSVKSELIESDRD